MPPSSDLHVSESGLYSVLMGRVGSGRTQAVLDRVQTDLCAGRRVTLLCFDYDEEWARTALRARGAPTHNLKVFRMATRRVRSEIQYAVESSAPTALYFDAPLAPGEGPDELIEWLRDERPNLRVCFAVQAGRTADPSHSYLQSPHA